MLSSHLFFCLPFSSISLHCALQNCLCKSRKENPQKLTQLSFKISSKTPRGKKDSTKRHHHRPPKRQPGEQQFPIQVGRRHRDMSEDTDTQPEDTETRPNHLSFRFLTKVRSSSYFPVAAWIFLRTSLLVTWSLYEMFSNLR